MDGQLDNTSVVVYWEPLRVALVEDDSVLLHILDAFCLLPSTNVLFGFRKWRKALFLETGVSHELCK